MEWGSVNEICREALIWQLQHCSDGVVIRGEDEKGGEDAHWGAVAETFGFVEEAGGGGLCGTLNRRTARRSVPAIGCACLVEGHWLTSPA